MGRLVVHSLFCLQKTPLYKFGDSDLHRRLIRTYLRLPARSAYLYSKSYTRTRSRNPQHPSRALSPTYIFEAEPENQVWKSATYEPQHTYLQKGATEHAPVLYSTREGALSP
jgi:hypothetical protein